MEDGVLHSILNGTHSYLITYTTVRNFEKSRLSSDWLQQHCMYGGDPHFALPIVNSHRNSVKLKAIYQFLIPHIEICFTVNWCHL